MMTTTLAKLQPGDTFTPDNGASWIKVMTIFSAGGHILIIGNDDRVKANRHWGYPGEEVIVKT